MTLPDIATDADAVLGDVGAQWRHGLPPSYKRTREYYDKTKQKTWEAGSLEDIVSNLVKNWEIEASFKTDYNDWRTIDRKNYTFSVNGGPNIPGEKMTQIGTYNALLTHSKYYSPDTNSFEDSHRTFKRMMPTFAWEVLEVYAGPPVVSFRWRHWGQMLFDYVGYNDQGQKVRVKAHRDTITIEGTLVAKVNDKLQIQSIDVWYDPLALFNEATKHGAEVIVEDTKARTPSPHGDETGAGGRCPFTQS